MKTRRVRRNRINENQKITLTLGQLRKLVGEGNGKRLHRRINESSGDFISDFSRDSLGISFKGKFGSMRKAEEFVFYPVKDADAKIYIQSDGRWGEINKDTGILLLSAKHGFANNITLILDKAKGLAKTIQLEPEILERILSAVQNKNITNHRFDNIISVVDDD